MEICQTLIIHGPQFPRSSIYTEKLVNNQLMQTHSEKINFIILFKQPFHSINSDFNLCVQGVPREFLYYKYSGINNDI